MEESSLAVRFEIRDEYLKWLLIVPGLTLLLVFAILPYIWSFGISFYDYSYTVFGRAPEFIGFKNYYTIITNPDVWLRFQNTAKFAVTAVTVEFLLGLTLALILSEHFRGHRLVLTILVLPMMIAPEITAMVFKEVMFGPRIGVFNYFLNTAGIQFAGYGRDAFYSVIMVDAWTWTPFVMLMVLGGLSSVPKTVIESANIDGAGWWARFRYIVFPYARPFLLLALIFRFADALRTWEVIREWLDVPPPLGPNPRAIDMLPSYLYTLGFRAFKTSEMAATGTIMLLMSLILIYTYLRYLWRVERR